MSVTQVSGTYGNDPTAALLRDLYSLRGWTGGDVVRRVEIVDRAIAMLDGSDACFGHCDTEGWYSECVSKKADVPDVHSEPSDPRAEAERRWPPTTGGALTNSRRDMNDEFVAGALWAGGEGR